ncbi:MAG: hypothetical protein LC098_10455 [Burkholderiales bacterium]|nr:hypothetical protein [Burkholderiales bacterium]
MPHPRHAPWPRWRFALAVLRARRIVWPYVVALLVTLGAAAHVATQPMHHDATTGVILMAVSALAMVCFFITAIAAAQWHRQWREQPLLRLLPGGERLRRALRWRIAALGLVTLAMALCLSVANTELNRSGPDTPVALADVPFRDWLAWGASLAVSAAILAWAVARLRLHNALAVSCVLAVAPLGGISTWLLPVCVANATGLWWTRARFIGNSGTGRALPVRAQSDGTDANPPSLAAELRERWRAWRIGRAVTASPAQRLIALTAMAERNSPVGDAIRTVVAGVAFAAASWGASLHGPWFAAFALLLANAVFLLLYTHPVDLAALWLLPLGAMRERLGELLVAVSMRRVRSRLIAAGLLAIPLAVTISMLVPMLMPESSLAAMLGVPMSNVVERWFWAPFLLAFGVHGVAYAAHATLALWPKAHASDHFELLLGVTLAIAAGALLGGLIAADAVTATLPLAAPGFTLFAFVFGAALPAIAWALLRSRRRAWANADIAAITRRHAAWALHMDDDLAAARAR